MTDLKGVTDPLELESVNTDKGRIAEQLSFDYSAHNPHPVRSPNAAGGVVLRPHPQAKQPVYSAADSGITDAKGVADPFIIAEGGDYYLFHETIYSTSASPDLHIAKSTDLRNWTNQGKAIGSGGLYSWPHAFKWNGDWYMTPSPGPTSSPTHGTGGGFQLWKADDFPANPTAWSFVEEPLPGDDGDTHGDPVMFSWDGRWWAFTRDFSTSNINLYHTEGLQLEGASWSAHPSNPIFSGSPRKGGGRPVVHSDYIDTFWQGSQFGAGKGIVQYRISELDTSSITISELSDQLVVGNYRSESGFYTPWNEADMHHVDLLTTARSGQQFAVVDGETGNSDWAIGLFTPSETPVIACRAVLSSNYTLTTDGSFASNDGLFDDLDYQIRGQFNTSLGEFPVQRTGWYRVECQLTLDTTETGSSDFTVEVQNLNVPERPEASVKVPSTGEVTCRVSRRMYAEEGDKFEPRAAFSSTNDQTILADNEKSYFEVEYLNW